jgi:hypothetical protein
MGYERADFEDVWPRYLQSPPDLGRNSRNNPHEYSDSESSQGPNKGARVPTWEQASNPHEYRDVPTVPTHSSREAIQVEFDDLGTASMDELWHRYERGEL